MLTQRRSGFRISWCRVCNVFAPGLLNRCGVGDFRGSLSCKGEDSLPDMIGLTSPRVAAVTRSEKERPMLPVTSIACLLLAWADAPASLPAAKDHQGVSAAV